MNLLHFGAQIGIIWGPSPFQQKLDLNNYRLNYIYKSWCYLRTFCVLKPVEAADELRRVFEVGKNLPLAVIFGQF